MYCTAGKVASRNSNAAVVSATRSPLTRTCIRPFVGSMVIGCPALGSKTCRWLMVDTSSDADTHITPPGDQGFPRDLCRPECIADVLRHRPQCWDRCLEL